MTFKLSKLFIWRGRSLFWKLFFWFWLTMMVMLTAIFVVFAITIDPSNLLFERRALLRELSFESQKIQQQERWSPNFSSRSYFLFDKQGNVLGNDVIPDELLEAYKKNRKSRRPSIIFERGVLIVGPKKVILNGLPYSLYLTKEKPHLVRWRFQQALLNYWHLIAVAVFMSFILCVSLASYLVGPIRQLQGASRKLAKGHLSTRVGRPVTHRKDELGELAQDFDMMAEQLESLISGSQRLLRDVSHELRSPLTRLQLSVALARKKIPEANIEHDRIEVEIERLDHLIGQIIRYSRAQHGVSEQAWTIIDLHTLVQQLVNDCDFEAKACAKKSGTAGKYAGQVAGSQ